MPVKRDQKKQCGKQPCAAAALCCKDVMLWILISVATLLRKRTRFHDEKSTRYTKKTRAYNTKLTHSKNARKCVVMPTVGIVNSL